MSPRRAFFGSQKKSLIAKRVLPSEKQNVERGILSYDVEVRGIVFGVVIQPDAFPAVQSIVHAPARNPCYVKRRATDNACGDNGAYYHNQDLRCRFCAIKLFCCDIVFHQIHRMLLNKTFSASLIFIIFTSRQSFSVFLSAVLKSEISRLKRCHFLLFQDAAPRCIS